MFNSSTIMHKCSLDIYLLCSVIQDLTDQSSVPWGMKGAPGNTINLRSSVPGSVECSPMGHPSPGIDCFTDVFCVDPGTMSEGQSQSPRPLMDLHSGLSRDMGQMFVSQQPISAPITPLQEAEARTGVHGRPALSLMIPDEEISQTNSLIASKSSASQQASGAREGNTPHDLSAASSVTPEKVSHSECFVIFIHLSIKSTRSQKIC